MESHSTLVAAGDPALRTTPVELCYNASLLLYPDRELFFVHNGECYSGVSAAYMYV